MSDETPESKRVKSDAPTRSVPSLIQSPGAVRVPDYVPRGRGRHASVSTLRPAPGQDPSVTHHFNRTGTGRGVVPGHASDVRSRSGMGPIPAAYVPPPTTEGSVADVLRTLLKNRDTDAPLVINVARSAGITKEQAEESASEYNTASGLGMAASAAGRGSRCCIISKDGTMVTVTSPDGRRVTRNGKTIYTAPKDSPDVRSVGIGYGDEVFANGVKVWTKP